MPQSLPMPSTRTGEGAGSSPGDNEDLGIWEVRAENLMQWDLTTRRQRAYWADDGPLRWYYMRMTSLRRLLFWFLWAPSYRWVNQDLRRSDKLFHVQVLGKGRANFPTQVPWLWSAFAKTLHELRINTPGEGKWLPDGNRVSDEVRKGAGNSGDGYTTLYLRPLNCTCENA